MPQSHKNDDWAENMSNATWGVIFWVIGAAILGITALFRHQHRKANGEIDPIRPESQDVNNKRQNLLNFLGALLMAVGGVLLVAAVPRIGKPYEQASELLVVGLGVCGLGVGGLFLAGRAPQTPAPAPVEHLLLPATAYTISLPRSSKWKSEHALALLEQLLSTGSALAFQIVADHDGIRWQVVDVGQALKLDLLEGMIRSVVPDAQITTHVDNSGALDYPFYRYTSFYQQANIFVAPIKHVDDADEVDPLTTLVEAMRGLQPGERITYTVAVRGYSSAAYHKGQELITTSTIHPVQFFSNAGLADAFGKMMAGQDRVEKYVPRDQKVLEDKLRQKLYATALLIQVDSPDPGRLEDLLIHIDTTMTHFTRMPYNALHWVERAPRTFITWTETPEEAQQDAVLTLAQDWIEGTAPEGYRPPTLIFEPRELALLWHLPHERFSAPEILWGSKAVDVPEAVKRVNDGVILGMGHQRGRELPVRLSAQDRVTHLNIIGKTGTGKSTLLHHLIHQDIAEGKGLAVIDPHGKLIRDVLQHSIPMEREADVVLLDLANADYPSPLNPLSGLNGYTQTLRVVGIIERLFEGTEHAARMSSYLRAGLLLLQAQPQATMRDLGRLFLDDAYRERLLQKVEDPETQDFWDLQYNTLSPAMQRQLADPILNRIRPFYANPYLYPILCHPDSLDFRALMQSRKILLISLEMDEDIVPRQERDLLGALIVSRLQMSGMKIPTDEPFYLYIDEVQRFVTSSLHEVFSEARKYGLSFITAHQFLGQLSGKTLDAVMGNVGTTVMFGCSPDDAQALAAYTKPQFTPQDLVNLNRFEAAVKLQVNGQTQPAFSLRTLEPIEIEEGAPDPAERESAIRQAAIRHYTPKRREEVLTWLKQRYPRQSVKRADASDEETFYESKTVD
jgi:hypothetical protein